MSLTDSGITNVVVDPESRFLRVSGGLLMDFQETCLIRCFGPETDVIVSNTIESISNACFYHAKSLSSVTFAAGCRVSSFGHSAFCACSLQSICIPSTLETMGAYCFMSCYQLETVTFEPGSKLSMFSEDAFACCRSLQSIWLPSSLESISPGSFGFVGNQVKLVLPADSKLSPAFRSRYRDQLTFL
jgi:hypothetical protein